MVDLLSLPRCMNNKQSKMSLLNLMFFFSFFLSRTCIRMTVGKKKKEKKKKTDKGFDLIFRLDISFLVFSSCILLAV